VKAQQIAELAKYVMETEHEYNLTGERSETTLPFMPYQPADFIGILWECMPELSGHFFMDVGCGPGTKMKIAQDLFGLDVHGIEIDPDMRAVAEALFSGERRVYKEGDALNCSFYGNSYDLIWLYRPLRDKALEYKLEKKITDAMKPGAILAGGSWEMDVATLGWHTIVDDCMISPDGSAKIWRGAWMKPGE
jgi:SAM-dependent methyltransferase